MSDEKTEAAKAEVHRLLEAKFIESVAYPTLGAKCWNFLSGARGSNGGCVVT
jgi:hypothetical protein